ALRDHRPHYQGALTLLVGPDRVEGGWWDRLPRSAPEAATAPGETDPVEAAAAPARSGRPPGKGKGQGKEEDRVPLFTALAPHDGDAVVECGHRNAVRDYWIAVNESAGVVAVFRQPLDDGGSAWFLHGVYA
ncbi:hypothetical protein N5D62_26670, partial [Mitsuaria sp. GD03876]|nr:hypothetical protein [Mitsuaria sp. GD03876]